MFHALQRLWDLIDDYVLYPIESAVRWGVNVLVTIALWLYRVVLTPVGRAVAWVLDWVVFRPLDAFSFWRRGGGGMRIAGRVTQPLANGVEGALMPATVEERRAGQANVGLAALLLFVCLGTIALHWTRNVGDLTSPTALELAQTARNVADGRGFTTSVIRPLSFTFSKNVSRHPDFTVSPLQALVTSVAFALHEPSDRVTALASGLFLLPTLWLLYRIAWHVGRLPVAALAVLSYVLAPGVLREAFSGTATQLTTCLFTLWVYLALFRGAEVDDEGSDTDGDEEDEEGEKSDSAAQQKQPDEEEPPDPWSWKQLVTLGAAFGALALADWHFALLWPVALVFAVYWSEHTRWIKPGLLFLAGLVLVLSPLLVRNFRLTGDPTFSLQSYTAVTDTTRFPGTSLLRTVSPPSHHATKLLVTNLRGAAKKAALNLVALRDRLPNWLGAYFFTLLLLGFMVRSTRVNAWGLKLPLLAFLLCHTLLGCVFATGTSGFLPFTPLALVLAANALLNHIAGRYIDDETYIIKRRTAAAHTGLPVLIVALGAASTVVGFFTGAPPENPGRALAATAEQRFAPDAVLVSDVPWTVAWYAKRTAVWAPQSTEDLALIQTQLTPLRGAVLTRSTGALGGERLTDAIRWTRLYTNPTFFAGYLPQDRLKDGTVIYRNVREVNQGTGNGSR